MRDSGYMTSDSDEETSADRFEPASAYLEAALVPRAGSVVTKAARTALTIAAGLLTNDLEAGPSGMQLVVTRRDSGNEIIRVVAGTPAEADKTLAKVRRDLAAKSVADFLSAWSDSARPGRPHSP